MTLLLHVDAFTDTPFAGNPAAVCLLDEPRDDGAWMQAVAEEMNLPETAFVVPRGDGTFDLRWFTPTVEVELCGHATLASAHALWETGRLAPQETARFHTRSGLLTAAGGGPGIELDFPARPVRPVQPVDIEALGAPGPTVAFDNGDNFLVQLDDEAAVLATAPSFRDLAAAADHGWIVTAVAASDRDADFVSRFFAPRYGIDEDPVTGSAHCALAPFWAERLGRDELIGHQLSARGGVVHVAARGDRVTLGGAAVTVLRADLLV